MKSYCRFYENKFPKMDEIVMANVKLITHIGAYVSLLEYNNIEGMILLSELSRRRIRSINKLIRVGKHEAVMVLRVDEEKGYIDLSKRRVSSEDVEKCIDKYQKAKAINSILRHVAETNSLDLEVLYEKTVWHLCKIYGNIYDAFKLCLTEPNEVMAHCDIEDNLKKLLLLNIQRRLTSEPIKIRADIHVSCFAYGGIDVIKTALKAGATYEIDNLQIKVNLVAAPHYVVTTMALDKDKGMEAVKTTIKIIEKSIVAEGGQFLILTEPYVTNTAESPFGLERGTREGLTSLVVAIDDQINENNSEEDMSEEDN